MPKIVIDIPDATMEDYQDLVHKIRGMAASEGLYDDKNPSQKAKALGVVLDILTEITNGTVLPEYLVIGDGIVNKKGVLEKMIKTCRLSVTPMTKTGHWISTPIKGEIDDQIVKAFICSKCGAISVFRMIDEKIVNGNLCANCGAKMEVDE